MNYIWVHLYYSYFSLPNYCFENATRLTPQFLICSSICVISSLGILAYFPCSNAPTLTQEKLVNELIHWIRCFGSRENTKMCRAREFSKTNTALKDVKYKEIGLRAKHTNITHTLWSDLFWVKENIFSCLSAGFVIHVLLLMICWSTPTPGQIFTGWMDLSFAGQVLLWLLHWTQGQEPSMPRRR